MLEVRQVSKRFGELVANDDISLSVAPGKVLALLGENGAGKSTLVSILFGQYRADSGAVFVNGLQLPAGDTRAAIAAGIGMVHQHFTLAENLSVLDNVMIGLQPLTRLRAARGALRQRLLQTSQDFGLAVQPDALVRDLSVGERQRVEILKALLRGAKYLILDEPTAVLTPGEAQALFATLERFVAQGLAIIFISHKLGEVLAVSDEVIVLRAGRIVSKVAAAQASAEQLAHAMVGHRAEAPAPVATQGETSAGALPAAGVPVAASPIGVPPFVVQTIDVPPADEAAIPAAPVVLALDRVSASQGPHRTLVEADLQVHRGEIVAIAGVAGNGQQALADLLCGQMRPGAGSLTLDGAAAPVGARRWIDAGVARIPEDRLAAGVVGDLSLAENAIVNRHRDPEFCRFPRLSRCLHVLDRARMRARAQRIVERFDVRCRSVDQSIRTLSGGNVQKFIVGRELGDEPRLVIANQPTWGLDVGAVDYVHRQLRAARERGAAVLLISEDLDEVFAIADRVAVIFQGRLGPALPVAEWTQQQIGLAMAGGRAADAARAS